MNAAAYLKNQGWRGQGHALHYSGRGITKPVHIPQKADVLGVGKKQHDAYADQWWARAFDDTLKGLSMTADKATAKTERISVGSDAQASQMVGMGEPRWRGQGGLYSNFVKGESLIGTFKSEEDVLLETRSRPKDQVKKKRGCDGVGVIAGVAKKNKWSKGRRREKEGEAAERSKSLELNAIRSHLKSLETEQRCAKTWPKQKNIETKEQRQQRKRARRAQRTLKAEEGCELPR